MANERARMFLERALQAEARADELAVELADARARLRAVLGHEPSGAVAALGWMARCRRSEELLRQVMRHVDQQSLSSIDLPPGWVARAEAQIKAADIADRQAGEIGFEGPEQGDYWEEVNSGRRPTVIKRRQP